MIVLFFFNDTATTEIYTLSLHDALPISEKAIPMVNALTQYVPHFLALSASSPFWVGCDTGLASARSKVFEGMRSEEHTSELQSRQYLVCRLLLEKKKHQYATQPRIISSA